MERKHICVLFALILSSIPSRVDAAPKVPNGYVFTPGGWTHPSCIHEIPDGATFDAQHGDVVKDGRIVAHHEPCAFKPVPSHSRPDLKDSNMTETAGPSYGGWVEADYQYAATGQKFDVLTATMTVPTNPTQTTPQTIYYFPGLESTLDNNCGIMQPVLQWGVSPAGGGAYWSIGSWWWGTTNQAHTGLVRVNSGDQIHGYMVLVSGIWQITTLLNGGYATGLNIFLNSCRYNLAFPATFEVDGATPIDSCNQVPAGSVAFNSIGLAVGNGYPDWNWVTFSPTAWFPIGSTPPKCGWGITNYAGSALLKM
jgi:hypothetical protein